MVRFQPAAVLLVASLFLAGCEALPKRAEAVPLAAEAPRPGCWRPWSRNAIP